MTKVNISIKEIMHIFKFKDPIMKIKCELIDSICAFDNKYTKNIEILLYLNITTLNNILQSLTRIKHPNQINHSDIVLREDIIYY